MTLTCSLSPSFLTAFRALSSFNVIGRNSTNISLNSRCRFFARFCNWKSLTIVAWLFSSVNDYVGNATRFMRRENMRKSVWRGKEEKVSNMENIFISNWGMLWNTFGEIFKSIFIFSYAFNKDENFFLSQSWKYLPAFQGSVGCKVLSRSEANIYKVLLSLRKIGEENIYLLIEPTQVGLSAFLSTMGEW